MADIQPAWFALPLLLATLAAGVVVIGARSLFAMCMALAAASALGAATAALLHAGEAGLALALFGVGWAPALLLAAMLLSARTAKAPRAGLPWLSVAAAALTAAAIFWGASDFTNADARSGPLTLAVAPWMAIIVYVAALSALALLGFGERGVLGPGSGERGQ